MGKEQHEKLIADKRQSHIHNLFTAELQFRLASAVGIATTKKTQPLDLPMEWTFGKHSVKYGEIALRQDRAEYASSFLDVTAVYMMAMAMRSAFAFMLPNADASEDSNIRAAHWITVMLRNAFAHDPFRPVWKIDRKCRNQKLLVRDIIEVDTDGLHGNPLTGGIMAARWQFLNCVNS